MPRKATAWHAAVDAVKHSDECASIAMLCCLTDCTAMAAPANL
eukprot:CAMPEP_0184389346 /NCGR_PEP_ID=MMETSP0007-20130409/12403_1 /TAXON_ID=97485 /ORGANISM="Prymnesium parvum, Strain Texoma1" /LENGTH=42 /DNA_ID= /DNA_START= /DNA_END= /DNA_ORIENTATION=